MDSGIADFASVALTGALVVITGLYAWLTFRISQSNRDAVRAMREQIDASFRPYITVVPFAPPKSQMLYLRVRNDGRSPARNVRLKLDRDYYQYGQREPRRNLATLSGFSRSIGALAPGQQITWGLAMGAALFSEENDPAVTPIDFVVSAEYEYAGHILQEAHAIDLAPYQGAILEPDPIVERLDAIAQALSRRTR